MVDDTSLSFCTPLQSERHFCPVSFDVKRQSIIIGQKILRQDRWGIDIESIRRRQVIGATQGAVKADSVEAWVNVYFGTGGCVNRSPLRRFDQVMSSQIPKPKFIAADLTTGKKYRLVAAFVDYDGIPHPIGESWRGSLNGPLSQTDPSAYSIRLILARTCNSRSFRRRLQAFSSSPLIMRLTFTVSPAGIALLKCMCSVLIVIAAPTFTVESNSQSTLLMLLVPVFRTLIRP